MKRIDDTTRFVARISCTNNHIITIIIINIIIGIILYSLEEK